MPNMLQVGAEWLGRQLHAHAGQSFTYTRKGWNGSSWDQDITITATVAMQQYEVESRGILTLVKSFDFIVAAADLTFMKAGTPSTATTTPFAGDKLAAVDEPGVVYEVTSLGEQPCFEPLDTSGQLLLIHTKRIE